MGEVSILSLYRRARQYRPLPFLDINNARLLLYLLALTHLVRRNHERFLWAMLMGEGE